MDTSSDARQIQPDEARAALDRAASTTVATRRDRTVYAVGLALFGIVVAVYVIVSRMLDDTVNDGVLAGVYAVLLLALAGWQKRAARSVPRGAKRAGYVGLAFMVLLSFVAIGVLNWDAQSGDPALALLVVSGLAVAAPMLVAAALVHRRTV